MNKNTQYELDRTYSWITFFYGAFIFCATLFLIFYQASENLPWWIFFIIPLISVAVMIIIYQKLFYSLFGVIYQEDEELKKKRVTKIYYRKRIHQLIWALIIMSLLPILLYLIL